MIILGNSFLSADYSYSPTPTYVDNIREVSVGNAKFDTFLVSNNPDMEKTFDVPTTWDQYTLLLSTYDGDTSAGNVDYTLKNTSDVLIKRRIKGSYDWTTIYHKHIETIEDFDILFLDKYCKNNKTYEYAYVGVLNGAESNYNIVEVDSKFKGMFIMDQDNIYGTMLNLGRCDTTRNHYLSKQEYPAQKYPGAYSYSQSNYDSGEASGYFVRFDSENCEFLINDNVDYMKEIIDFLTNHKPKILKLEDGRIWLISVDGMPTDVEDGHYLHRIISFAWFESGNYNSEEDLYDADLIDVEEQYWSN